MSYIFYDKKKNVLDICDERGYIENSTQLGELLMSFLELDFVEFEECRSLLLDFVNDEYNNIDLENIIIKKYSKTTSYFRNQNKDFKLESFTIEFLESNQDIKNIKNIFNHPYIKYSEIYEHKLYMDDYVTLESEFNFKKIQECYIKLINFCFDVEYNIVLNNLTALQRFYLFIMRFGNDYYYDQVLKYRQVILPFLPDMETSNKLKEMDIDINLVEYIKEIDPYEITASICETPKDLIINELYNMLNYNIKIKKCKNCNNYFVLKGDYNTDYCDRILPGKKFTCKKIAAINARKEKIKGNPILWEFEKGYKRNYAKCANKKISKKEFSSWLTRASLARDNALGQYGLGNDDDVLQQFKKAIGNK